MIVARQFIAWYPCKKGNRPVGHGMIGSNRRATIRSINQPWVSIRPSLRDGFSIESVPAFGAGYDHLVPPGQRPTTASRRIVFAFDETSFLLHRCYQEPSPLSDTFFPFQS
jgi:hypothetical protein